LIFANITISSCEEGLILGYEKFFLIPVSSTEITVPLQMRLAFGSSSSGNNGFTGRAAHTAEKRSKRETLTVKQFVARTNISFPDST
jgi:hypothetical protein